MGLGGSDGEGGGSGSGSPMAVTPAVFPLPHEYEAAKDRKVASVADLRNAVKTVRAAVAESPGTIAAAPISAGSAISRTVLTQ